MRPFFAGLLLVVAVLLLPLADIGIWVQRQLVPTDAFLDVTTEVLGEPEVQQALAERITEELVAREPRLGSNQGILTPAIRQAVDSAAFDQVLRASLGTMHEQLTGGEDVLALDLDSALPVVRSQVEGVNASVAQQIPTDLAPITVLERDEAPALWKAVELTRQASWLLPLLTLVLLAGAVAVAVNHARMLIVVGIATTVAAIVVVALVRLGRDPLSDVVDTQVSSGAFNASYDAVTGSLVTQSVILAIVGIVVALFGVLWTTRSRGNERPAFWA